MAKAFLTRPVTFARGKYHYTAREGTPVVILESEKQTVHILFKFFTKWVHQRNIKQK